MSSCLSREKRNALINGQVISIFIAGTGVFATLLSSTTPSSNFPSLMSLFNYVLLSSFLFRNRCSTIYGSSNQNKNSINGNTEIHNRSENQTYNESNDCKIYSKSEVFAYNYFVWTAAFFIGLQFTHMD